MENLTELEQKVVKVLNNGDHFEDVPTECIGNLIDNTGLKGNVLRGVLSSLIKKGVVATGEFPNGMTAFHLVDNLGVFDFEIPEWAKERINFKK